MNDNLNSDAFATDFHSHGTNRIFTFFYEEKSFTRTCFALVDFFRRYGMLFAYSIKKGGDFSLSLPDVVSGCRIPMFGCRFFSIGFCL